MSAATPSEGVHYIRVFQIDETAKTGKAFGVPEFHEGTSVLFPETHHPHSEGYDFDLLFDPAIFLSMDFKYKNILKVLSIRQGHSRTGELLYHSSMFTSKPLNTAEIRYISNNGVPIDAGHKKVCRSDTPYTIIVSRIIETIPDTDNDGEKIAVNSIIRLAGAPGLPPNRYEKLPPPTIAKYWRDLPGRVSGCYTRCLTYGIGFGATDDPIRNAFQWAVGQQTYEILIAVSLLLVGDGVASVINQYEALQILHLHPDLLKLRCQLPPRSAHNDGFHGALTETMRIRKSIFSRPYFNGIRLSRTSKLPSSFIYTPTIVQDILSRFTDPDTISRKQRILFLDGTCSWTQRELINACLLCERLVVVEPAGTSTPNFADILQKIEIIKTLSPPAKEL